MYDPKLFTSLTLPAIVQVSSQKFEVMEDDMSNLFIQIKQEIIQTEGIAVDDLQSFLCYSFLELCNEIEIVESLEELLTIITIYSSPLNLFYLKAVSVHFKLQNTIQLVQSYDETVLQFLKEVPIKNLYGLLLMQRLNRPLLKSETVKFILEGSAEEVTLYYIQQVLIDAFHTLVHHIILKMITSNGDEICLHAAFHLRGELLRLIQTNKESLRESGVLSVSIAGCVVICRDIRKEVNICLYDIPVHDIVLTLLFRHWRKRTRL